MLASTVKFSTNNRHPTPPPGQRQADPWGPHPEQPNPAPQTTSPTTGGRAKGTVPDPSGPNNVPGTTPTSHPAFPSHPEEQLVLTDMTDQAGAN
jgi:hypothetical protein